MKEKYQAQPDFVVSVMQDDDVDSVTRMRLQSWLDTYVNDEYGVTREWIAARNKDQMSPKMMQSRKERLHDPNVGSFVAKDTEGAVIGVAMTRREDGVQHLGSLYVDKVWHGTGVASALMMEALRWSDPQEPMVLEVVAYNERAKAFYRKWGFVEMPGSEKMFEHIMPEITMMRKGDAQS